MNSLALGPEDVYFLDTHNKPCWLCDSKTLRVLYENKIASLTAPYIHESEFTASLRKYLKGDCSQPLLYTSEEKLWISIKATSITIKDLSLKLLVAEQLEASPKASLNEIMLYGKIGSAELSFQTKHLLLSQEFLVLLDHDHQTPLLLSLDEFISKYVSASYKISVRDKLEVFLKNAPEVESVNLSFCIVTDTKKHIWVDSKWSVRNDSVLCIMQDVTEKKISLSDSLLRGNVIKSMLIGITDGFFALDRGFNFLIVNPTFSKLAAMSTEEMQGKNILDLFPDMKGSETIRHYADAMTMNEARTFEINLTSQGIIYEVLAYPFTNGLFVYFRDVTRTRSVQHEQKKLDKIVRESHNEIYIINNHTLKFEYANDAALRNIGYTLQELSCMRFIDLFNHPDEFAIQAILNALRSGQSDRINLVLKYHRKDDTTYDADVLIQVLEKDASCVLFVTDISGKLITEQKLLQNIQEKEMLIQEIHHRVKNNLQLISSILFLKLHTVPHPEFRAFLERTRNRIHSIALIHERLLQTQFLDQVDINDYLTQLIYQIEISSREAGAVIEVRQNIERQILKIDTAIYCGLIVNELVTNAFKHAFKDKDSGLIEISFIRTQNAFILDVVDNGNMLPHEIEPGTTSTFGMQLVSVFVKQLHGKLDILRDKGTKFHIEFKR